MVLEGFDCEMMGAMAGGGLEREGGGATAICWGRDRWSHLVSAGRLVCFSGRNLPERIH